MIHSHNMSRFSIQFSRILAVSSLIMAVIMAVILAAASPFAHAQQIAFTWDDLPSHSALPPGETRVEIGKRSLSAMKNAHMPPAYGFVNGIHTEDDPLSTPMLKEWRDAGLPLGNHTWSHMNLNQHSVADWGSRCAQGTSLFSSRTWAAPTGIGCASRTSPKGTPRRSAMRRGSFWPSTATGSPL